MIIDATFSVVLGIATGAVAHIGGAALDISIFFGAAVSGFCLVFASGYYDARR